MGQEARPGPRAAAGRRAARARPAPPPPPHTHTPAHPPPPFPPQAIEFAQSKGNARRDGSTGVTFADVGGLGGTVAEMGEVVEVRAIFFLPLPLSFSLSFLSLSRALSVWLT